MIHWAVYREGCIYQGGYQYLHWQHPQFQRQLHLKISTQRFQVTKTSVKISIAVKSASPS